MKYLLLSMLYFPAITLFSQQNVKAYKECRLAAGGGIANGVTNTVSIGRSEWIQMSYGLANKVSIASEYENMHYNQPSYYSYVPPEYDKISVYDHNISLLFKYHITDSKVRVSVVSGWTYTIKQTEYYQPDYSSNGVSWFRQVWTSNQYKIPLQGEVEYPILKTINVQGRVRYNLVADAGSTYSAGLGLSLKL